MPVMKKQASVGKKVMKAKATKVMKSKAMKAMKAINAPKTMKATKAMNDKKGGIIKRRVVCMDKEPLTEANLKELKEWSGGDITSGELMHAVACDAVLKDEMQGITNFCTMNGYVSRVKWVKKRNQQIILVAEQSSISKL